MTASMTAYARQSIQQPWGQATWELRSVNHRYLDLAFKMPEVFRAWEIDWRTQVNKVLKRGKVECYLTFLPSSQTAPQLQVDKNLVNQLVSSCALISQAEGVESRIKAMELLRWPGVIIQEANDVSALKSPLSELLISVLDNLQQMRLREGQQLNQFMMEKLNQVQKQVAIVKERLPQCVQVQKQRLMQKLLEITENVEKDRLEQELVYHAHRLDVEEEVSRLGAHVKEVMRVLNEEQTGGRRLDFLMQEMNREANTLASKSLDEIVTNAAVELKVLIEQMREQIQNVE